MLLMTLSILNLKYMALSYQTSHDGNVVGIAASSFIGLPLWVTSYVAQLVGSDSG